MVNPFQSFSSAKPEGRKLVTLTAYDFPTAKILDAAGIDMILVGDSLGMVVLGHEDTTFVTMADMLHHLRAVVRAVESTPVVVDLPFGSVETPELAVQNARLFMDAGADAVKLEGGQSMVRQIQAITAAGIPVVAHIGMLPQRVREEGGYKIKGRNGEQARYLSEDAAAVEQAGAIAVVLELVEASVAESISRALKIPTIGIGSGRGCDGQILVIHDLIGFFPWFTPKFAIPRAKVSEEVQRAVAEYKKDVLG